MYKATSFGGTKRRGRKRPAAKQAAHVGASRSVQLPRAKGTVKTGSRPATVHSRTERFATVTGNGGLAYASYKINPAQRDIFRWFHEIAGLYDRYLLKSMRFRYVPATGTDVAGSVLLAFDPEALDQAPASMEDAQQMSTEAHGPVWVGFEMPLPLDRILRYTRPEGGVTPVTADLKSYDAGILHVLVDGTSATVGYVEVDYVIELRDPQPSRTLTGFLPGSAGYSLSFGYDMQAHTSGDPINPNHFAAVHNALEIVNDTDHWTIPAGTFDIMCTTTATIVNAASTAANFDDYTIAFADGAATGTFDPSGAPVIWRSPPNARVNSLTGIMTSHGHARVNGPMDLQIILTRVRTGTGDTDATLNGSTNLLITQVGYA